MIITNNLLSANAALNLGLVKDSKTKSMEKLSSGYRVNRASDDAAGLSISEKMRSQVRGLMRAAQNTTDGISLVQTTDGATDQAGNILQRMRELTVQALNVAVNTEDDRAKIQQEFDQLQSELDRINDQTEFNKKSCFNHYATDHYVTEGNITWIQDQVHSIDNRNNSMTIKYKTEPDTEDDAGNPVISPEKEVTIRVPNGTYTTQQLADEIDDAIAKLGLDPEKIGFEYTDDGMCNLVLDNGAEITDMSGGLTYLFHDEYAGSEVGSVIGTTQFEPGTKGLQIYSGHNDHIEFTIRYTDGRGSVPVSFDIPTTPDDFYTRQEMIDFLNQKLAGTEVSAIEYGEKAIMLGSDKAIVTGLRGNMFEIDDPNEPGTIIATSVFYDNTKYGKVTTEPAVFTGGDVINQSDTWWKNIKIDDTNNLIRVRVNDKTGEYKEVRLANGTYSANQMVSNLNQAFSAAGVGLKASLKDTSTNLRLSNGKNIELIGFKVETTEEGKSKSIEFDTTTEAYKTLFTNRVYTNEGQAITSTGSNYYIYRNSLIGSKAFSGSQNLPLVIDDTNKSMTLSVWEKPINGTNTKKNYTLTFAAGTYNDAESIATMVNNSLAAAGASGKVSASATNDGRISLVPANDKTIGYQNSTGNHTISGSGTGYRAVFIGTQTSADESESIVSGSSKTPVLVVDENTLPENPKGNITYRFQINNENRYVNLPNATYTKDEFLAKLNEELGEIGDTYTSFYVNDPSTHYGTTTNRNVNKRYEVPRETEITTIVANAQGSGVQQQGTTVQTPLTPAKYTVPVSLPNSMTIDGKNDMLRIKVNGNTYDVTLTQGDYTSASAIATEIQTQLDGAISRSGDKMKVTLDGSNQLVFETVEGGQNVSFSMGNRSGVGDSMASSFLHGLTSVRNPAAVQTGLSVQSNVNIPAGATLTIKVNGENKTISWDSDSSYASRNDFLNALNTRLSAVGVVASNTSNLTFTTVEKGEGTSIEINTANSAAFSNAVFGQMQTTTPASMTLNRSLKSDSQNIPMKAGENTFTITVGSQGYTSTFEVGRNYSRQEILDKLNQDFAGVANVTMSSGGALTFKTVAEGSSASIKLYNNRQTLSGMFGQSVTHHPGVTASVDENGYLKLTGNESESNYTIRMFRKDGSDILPANQQTSDIAITHSSFGADFVGVYSGSSNHALTNNISITSDNNKLTFRARTGTGSNQYTDCSVTVPEGTYTLQDLESKLQELINANLGTGKLTVSHNSLPGLTFSSFPNYDIYNITNWGGSFYSRIIKGDADVNETVTTTSKDGAQSVSATYTVGRKNVRNQMTTITPNTNDTFSLELYKDNVKTEFSFTLDPGTYTSDELVNMLNTKLSQAAEAKGLPKDIVKAAVGRYNTGVVGSDDANALDFYLNPDVELDEGKYRIEGLSGTSMFDIFYKTVGDLTPAYTTGTKDIRGGVDIPEGKQEFSITVDDVVYNYTIDPSGHYTGEEFVDKLNDMIQAGNPTAPIKASLSRGAIRFSHEDVGRHTVTSVKGPAIQAFYYASDAAYGESEDEWLQVGANENQGITFKKYSVSSHALGVNTVNLTEKKYADKALNRIDEALGKLMTNRSRFGALQNRLEFTRDIDTNTAINLQAAESRIRDTDMADEAMQLSKKSILEQAGMSVLSQAVRQPQSVLSLLKQ